MEAVVAPNRASFLGLPPELRNEIYRHYVAVPGGYVFNLSSNKLKPAGDASIGHPFALQRVCRQISQEMEGLPLSHNTVTFSTIFSTDVSARAYIFDTIMIGGSATIKDLVSQEFPHLLGTVAGFVEGHHGLHHNDGSTFEYEDYWYNCHLGVVERHECVHELLLLVLQHTQPDVLGLQRHQAWINLMRLPTDTWMLPTLDELDPMVPIMRQARSFISNKNFMTWDAEWYSQLPAEFLEYELQKWCFSAAATAINFLASLAPSTRAHLRKVVVWEDGPSTWFPECHGRGLVPFCDENPRLRIERRVCLWKVILSHCESQRARIFGRTYAAVMPHLPTNGVFAHNIRYGIGHWMREARQLPPATSLLLDGDLSPAKSSEIFQDVVIRDAALQHAFVESVKRGILAPPTPVWEDDDADAFESWPADMPPDFPQMVLDVLNGHSHDSSDTGRDGHCRPQIRCNFYPGSPPDVEQIISNRAGWSWGDWRRTFYDYDDESEDPRPAFEYHPDPPMSWRTIFFDTIPVHLREKWIERYGEIYSIS